MYPILGRYGPFFLYSYTVVLGLGLAAGIGLTAWLEKKEAQDKLKPSPYPGWLDGLLVSVLAAFIGGRIGFVWANWSYYLEAPGEIVVVWQGGLSYHGALVSGLLVFWLWAIWRRRTGRTEQYLMAYAGLIMPGLVLAHFFGWLACWLEGCGFGRETVLGFLATDLPDSFGVQAVRYQTQLMGLVLTAVVFITAMIFRKRLTAVDCFWLTLALLSASQGLISLYRGDIVLLVGSFRLDTVLSVGLVLASIVGLVRQKRENKRQAHES